MTVRELVNWLSTMPQDFAVTAIYGRNNLLESCFVVDAYLVNASTMDDIDRVVPVTE